MARPAADGLEQDQPDSQKMRRDLFLAALARSSCVRVACRASNLAPSTAYYWRQSDPTFKRAWNDALQESLHSLEMDLVRRFRKGVKRKIFHAGKVVGSQIEYQDGLALKLLAMQRQVQTSDAGGQEAGGASIEPMPRTSLDAKIDALRVKMQEYDEEEARARRDRLSGR